ncbi:MAG: GTPase [candidate division WOR-3 bacterium]
MPANLSPEYKKAEERFRLAVAPEEKLACLEEMLSAIPKHKGTEKMQADIKSRIARLRKELSAPGKSGTKRSDWYHVDKQGAGQAAVFGAPNCGKSALVSALTGLPAVVAPYPFSTTVPAAGMMPYEDIQIQLVDTPPIVADSPAWLYHIIRTADLGVWLLDVSDDAVLETTEQTRAFLAAARIPVPVPQPPQNSKPVILCGSKSDDPAAADRLAVLRELLPGTDILPVSVQSGAGLEELKRRLFVSLGIIRVYTKKPGKPPDLTDPVILKAGATVIDVAYHLHKDIAASLSFARLWRAGGTGRSPGPHDGQRVERNHVCQDRDILEFHT